MEVSLSLPSKILYHVMKFSITHCLAGCCPYPVDTLRICRPDLISVNSNKIYIYIYINNFLFTIFSYDFPPFYVIHYQHYPNCDVELSYD